jgi:hypothetical protein
LIQKEDITVYALDVETVILHLKSMQNKARFEAKAGPGKKSLAFLVIFEEINALKRQLKPEKTASSKKSKVESLIHPLY